MSSKNGGIKPPTKAAPKPVSRSVNLKKDTGTLSRASSVSTVASVSGSVSPSNGKLNFEVKERVWVNGTKPGIIEYIGETQFAPGIWAGVKLDDCTGKNDGSVAGVRYFDCEQHRGIFTRPQRLTREAVSTPPSSVSGDGNTSVQRQPSSPHGSLSCSRLKCGEKVIVNSVNGKKMGTLRFVGKADFADGEWAGIELDQPLGKNDGSIGGKRYFECRMKYGLFAPTYKVTCARGITSPRSTTGSIPKRSHSRESLNSSVSSVTSSRASGIKLGVNALSSKKKTQRSPTPVLSPTQAALQEALKEKIEHIEQLLKEKDEERTEFAELAAHKNELEEEIVKLKSSHHMHIQENEAKVAQLRASCEKAEAQSKSLDSSLAEEKRKVEDLQFRLEEEMIFKGELEASKEKDEKKIKELEEICQKEVENFKSQKGQGETVMKLLEEKEKVIVRQEEALNALKNAISEKDGQHSDLTSQLGDAVAKISEMSKQLIDFQNKCCRLNSEKEEALRQKEEVSNTLKDQLTHYSTAIEEKNRVSSEMEIGIAELTSALETKDQHIAELTNILSKTKEQVNELKQGMNENVSARASELDQLRIEKEKFLHEKEEKDALFTKEVEKITNQLNEKEQMFRNACSEMASLSKTLEEKDLLIQKTTVDLKEAKEEIESLGKDKSSTVLDLQNKISEMRSQRDIDAAENEKNLQNQKEMMSLLRERERTISEKENMRLNLENTIAEKDAQSSVVHIKLENALNKVGELSKTVADLQTEYAQLASEKQKEIEDKENTVVALRAEISQYVTSFEAKSIETLKSQGEINNLKTVLEAKEDQIADLASLVEKSQKELEQLKEQHHSDMAKLESRVIGFKEEQEKYVQAREKKLQEEVLNLQALLFQKEKDLEQFSNSLLDLQPQVDHKDGEIHRLQQKLTEVESELQKRAESEKTMRTELETRLQSCAKLETEKDQVIKQMHASEEARRELEIAKDVLIKDKLQQENMVKDREVKLQSLQNEVNRMSQEFTKHKHELQQKLDVSQAELEAMKELKKELELQHGVLEELQEELHQSESEKTQLKADLQKTANLAKEKEQAETKLAEVQHQLLLSTKKIAEVSKQKENLQNTLQTDHDLLKERERDEDSLKMQLKSSQQEKEALLTSLAKLQFELAQKSASSDANDDDSKDQQINFLNSIIVDLKQENEELKLKAQARGEAFQTDLTFNGVRKIPPRLFCDICDLFDLHDTEDCPKQTRLLEDEMQHSKHRGKRHEERPYCNNCEIFGHWTLDCDDHQTF